MFLGNSTIMDDDESLKRVPLVAILICGCLFLFVSLEKRLWLHQSITALVISIYAGCLLLRYPDGKRSPILEFNQECIFIYLLPPIIFNVGFQVNRKQFFLNYLSITSFRVIGSLISFAAIMSFGAIIQVFRKFDIRYLEMKDYLGATQVFRKFDIGYLDMNDYLVGAIFSATEFVGTLQLLDQEETPLLYSLVLGEGVVNDATSVLLFNAITKFNLSDMNTSFGGSLLTLFVCSTFLGIFVGLLCGYIVRRTSLYRGRHSTDLKVALMLLIAYLSYITANVCNLSGILTVFFCGIVTSHYAWHNDAHKSQVTTKHSFATISYIAEFFSVLYVAIDSFDVEKWPFVTDSPGKSIGGSGILVVFIMVGRLGFILPLTYLCYQTRSEGNEKIGIKQQQIILWWAGLIRGAVSVALAYKKLYTGSGQIIQPATALLLSTTITLILFSTVVFGLLTKSIMRMLVPHSDETEASTTLTMPLLVSGHDGDHHHHHHHHHDTETENGNHLTPATLLSILGIIYCSYELIGIFKD